MARREVSFDELIPDDPGIVYNRTIFQSVLSSIKLQPILRYVPRWP